MKLHLRPTLAAAAAAAALALAGCSTAAAGSAAGPGGSTLTLGTITPVTTWDAADASWANESPYMQAVYDTLLHAAPDGTIEPWLATSWSYNATRTVLTMKLRNDVVFSDGTKFTAQVAAENILRFRAGTSPQKAYLASVKDAKAVNATTLQIDLSKPNPALLSFLTQNCGLMESPKDFGSKTEATVPDGSGPYVLDQRDTVVGSTYVFTKNPRYWGPKSQQPYSKLVMTDYQSPTAMLNAIKGGQVNAGTLTDDTMISQVKAAGYTVYGQSLNFFGLLLFDRAGTVTKALGDVRVRQAVNYALDRPALLKAVGDGYGQVTEQVFAPTSTAYDKSLDATYPYDPAKARQLLAAAGYAPGSITLTEPESNGFPPAAYSLIQQELADVGIKVNYVQEGNATFLPSALAGKYSSMLMQLKAGPSTWETITNNLLPTSGWNALHYDSSTVTRLARAIASGSTAQAGAAARQLNKYIVDQAWFAPIYYPEQSFFSDSHTTLKTQVGNAYPYLWNITPKQ